MVTREASCVASPRARPLRQVTPSWRGWKRRALRCHGDTSGVVRHIRTQSWVTEAGSHWGRRALRLPQRRERRQGWKRLVSCRHGDMRGVVRCVSLHSVASYC